MNNYRVKAKKRIVAVASGAVANLLLFFVKLYIGLSSNSIAIYADSLNSLTDFAVCIAAAVGFYLASSAPDNNYPFGKGRAEELTELLISAVILASGGAFAYMSFERILYPVPVWYSSVYAVIIAATATVKLAMAVFFLKVSAKLGSDAVKGIDLVYSFSVDYLAYIGIYELGSQRGCTVINIDTDGEIEYSAENYYQDKYVSQYEKEAVTMQELGAE